MTDRQRPSPSHLDVRSGRTLKFSAEPDPSDPEEPVTRRIPVQSVAKQRIILLARDVRARLSSSAIARALGESTLRGLTDVNETLERLSAAKETQSAKARVIDYRGADPFKAEVARALGRTEICDGPPPLGAVRAVADDMPEQADASAPEEWEYIDEVSPFAETSRSLPPPELDEHLRHLHEETRRSLTEPEPESEPQPELGTDEPKLPIAKLVTGVAALLGAIVLGNWPLSAQLVQANLASYSGPHELTSDVAGRVAKVLVSVGDHVALDQPVLQLEEQAATATDVTTPDAEPAGTAKVDAHELEQLQHALHASDARVEAQRGVVATLEAKRDRLMEAAAPPSKISATDDLVDAARGQLRALESAQLHAQQALAAKQPREPVLAPPAPAKTTVTAAHAGIVVQVLTLPGARLQPSSPVLSMLGDAAVPALVISCSEHDAELLLESPEVRLTVHDTQLTVLVTRVVELGSADGDDRRAVELALNDATQLAEVAKHAQIGMSVEIALPEPRTLFSQVGRWLRHEFQ